MTKDFAFTTLELLVAMLIMAILTAIAAPNYTATMDSFQRNAFLNQVISDLNEARARSLAEGSRIVIQANQNGSGYSIGIDNLPYNNPVNYDQVVNTRHLDAGNTINLASSIIFSSRGYLTDEYSDPTNVAITFYRHNAAFCTGTLYAVGSLEYDC